MKSFLELLTETTGYDPHRVFAFKKNADEQDTETSWRVILDLEYTYPDTHPQAGQKRVSHVLFPPATLRAPTNKFELSRELGKRLAQLKQDGVTVLKINYPHEAGYKKWQS